MKKIGKNRTAQLIFQSFFVALGVIGCVGSVGFFDMEFIPEFYIYFTNLSNYLCVGIMTAELVQTARKQTDGYVAAAPRLRFISMMGIILTFLVFNTLLANAPGRDPALNFAVTCILCHIVLPVMYVADWVLFYEHGKTSWMLLPQSALFPLIYVGYVYLHAALRGFDSGIMNYAGTDPIIYPYFFLNPERVGIEGIIKWVLVLSAAFLFIAFLFVMADHILGKRAVAKE